MAWLVTRVRLAIRCPANGEGPWRGVGDPGLKHGRLPRGHHGRKGTCAHRPGGLAWEQSDRSRSKKSYSALCDHVSQERWNERDNWTDLARQFICFAATVVTPARVPSLLPKQAGGSQNNASSRSGDLGEWRWHSPRDEAKGLQSMMQ